MKKLSLLLVMFLSVVGMAMAQRTISGAVTSTDGEPLIGASVLVKGTTTGTITDIDGSYELRVPAGYDVLVFSYTGFETQEITLGASNTVDVSLAQGVVLEEAVVTALGIERERKELGYAVTTVDGDEVALARSSNALESLSGRVPGLRVNTSSGTVGGSANVTIRGVSAFGTGQPLFVVDGVPISNSSFNGTRNEIIAGGADVGNRAGDINPDDIESISVLKGASAVTLYGQRARDGVIVIKTKRAKGNRLSVDVNSSLRFSNPLRLPDFQNEFASGNFGQYDTDNFVNGWGPRISDVAGQDFRQFPYDGEERPLQAQPDNVKDFFRTGSTFINNVAVSTRGDAGDIRVSHTYLNDEGIIPGNRLRRNTVAVNGGTSLSSKLRARTSVNYVRTEGFNRPRQGSNSPNVLISNVYGIPRTLDVNTLENNVTDENGNNIPLDGNGTSNNPYWIINNNPFDNTVDRVFGNVQLSYDVLPWLNVMGRAGTDFFTETRRNITAKGTFGQVNGLFEDRNILRRELNTDLIATVTRDISDDIGFVGLVGWNTNDIRVERTRVVANDLLAAEVYNPGNALSVANERFESQRRLYGGYFDLGFSLNDFLFLNITGRNDWSSTLPVNNRSYFYPGVSTSFIFTDALGISNDILSFGKLRASFAQVGSDEAPYQLDFLFTPATDIFTQFVANNTYPFGGQAAFQGPNVVPAGQNLVPQNQNTFEVGTELQFFKGRVGLDLTYYNTVTEDIIVSVAVAQSTGFEAIRQNAGKVVNEGIEVLLSVVPVRTKNFEWETVVNFTSNQQTVEELAPGLEELALTSGFSGLSVRAEPGQEFGLYGAAWERDPDGNIVVDEFTGLRIPGGRERLGDIFPDWMMGINNRFSYKNFTLTALVDISQGGVLFSRTVSGLRGSGLAEETLEGRGEIFIDQGVNEVVDGDGNVTYVPNETPVRSMQDFWTNYTNNNNTEGSVFDADYVKLREVTFSYTLPKSALGNGFIRELSIGVEARNLWLIDSKVPHIDPESSFFGPSLVGGSANIEFWSVPTARSIGANVRIKF